MLPCHLHQARGLPSGTRASSSVCVCVCVCVCKIKAYLSVACCLTSGFDDVVTKYFVSGPVVSLTDGN